ncbi:octanoyl-[acyl-carrier-protein]:protein N-octanoyltransferase LIPT2, mitochondrial isoform X2 [Macrobrachium rosenbergii]|uniref:octanoyl-[acyl-carrier-protein]:protein N-octanoyltransferase LIPT2, mitochondrial isoform X2 n=1 Tax=Macrobrachium rosenbergii TaxID=79674 RepID=UPI0034D488B5
MLLETGMLCVLLIKVYSPKMAQKTVYVQRLMQMNYKSAWDYQKKIAAKVQENVKMKKEPCHTLLLVEHQPVYTTGIRDVYSKEDEIRLRSLGADFYRTNRGGLITFHGPGQMVAYPILHLASFQPGIKWYVCALERTIIRTCRSLGVLANTSPHTGVWVGDSKICAVGIQGRHVTTHGIALNCNTELHWFQNIVPCGIPDKGVTTLSKELNRNVGVEEVVPHFLKAFADIFQCKLVEELNENNTL